MTIVKKKKIRASIVFLRGGGGMSRKRKRSRNPKKRNNAARTGTMVARGAETDGKKRNLRGRKEWRGNRRNSNRGGCMFFPFKSAVGGNRGRLTGKSASLPKQNPRRGGKYSLGLHWRGKKNKNAIAGGPTEGKKGFPEFQKKRRPSPPG